MPTDAQSTSTSTPMKTHSVRLGFATNSSSSHSIIILPPGENIRSDDRGEEYGWGDFTLTEPDQKRLYLGQHLLASLRSELPDDLALLAAKEWLGVSPDPDGHIDHQSVQSLPSRFDSAVVDAEFVADYAAFLDRDDVAILGGNDNSEPRPMGEGWQQVDLGLPESGRLVCRKEADGLWTLFNRSSGSRFTVDFRNPIAAVKPTRVDTPMLVDLKITDFCTFGCAFCYQGSTPSGKHSDHRRTYGVVRALAEMKVFEVAIGGGEPTMHPQFIEILESFRSAGIVPNFTTRNTAWLRDVTRWPRIIAAVGAFAYSTEDASTIAPLVALMTANGIPLSKLNIQYVMGSSSKHHFERMLTTCRELRLRLTLLGFKDNGRGAAFKAEPGYGGFADYSGWLDTLVKMRGEPSSGGTWFPNNKLPRLGIDTALAKAYEPQLLESGISPVLFHTEEGRFSMYWDLVSDEIGPSSFCSRGQMTRVPGQWPKTEDVAAIFRAFAD